MNRGLTAVLAVGLGLAVAAGAARSAPTGPLRWRKVVLDRAFRAEGAAVADVNRDGRADVLAGNLWYEAPNWNPHEIRPAEAFPAATGYSNCFLCFAADVNRDGWPDEIVIGFPGQASEWFRNPGAGGGPWQAHRITDSACNESPLLTDLTGDGTPELVTPHQESRMAYYSMLPGPRDVFRQHLIGQAGAPGCKRFSHGLGVADLNRDGRADILCTDGFYAAPARGGPRPWPFISTRISPDCAQMYGRDFDGDGDTDVISSSAHRVGVWWHEQVPGSQGPVFRTHVIDDTFSQSHALMEADLNGDGRPDYVTGKRVWAHGPTGDVNPNHPAMLCWYEWARDGSTVRWTRHVIDEDSGIGTGFCVADINNDLRPDVVTANKRGVFVFTQER